MAIVIEAVPIDRGARTGPQTTRFEKSQITIGRSPESDVVLVADSISRHHARIVVEPDRFVLVDASENGSLTLEGVPSFVLPRAGDALVQDVTLHEPCGSFGARLARTPHDAAEHLEVIVHFEGDATLRVLGRSFGVRGSRE